MTQKSFALVESAIVLIIILLLTYFFLNRYKGNIFNKKTQKALYESGIDSSRPSVIIHTTKEKVNAINKKLNQQQEQMNNLLK